jgi:hypothetical protein
MSWRDEHATYQTRLCAWILAKCLIENELSENGRRALPDGTWSDVTACRGFPEIPEDAHEM